MLDFRNSNRSFLKYSTFKFCSPSRSALQSGRNPISVNVQNVVPEVANRKDPVGGFQGHFARARVCVVFVRRACV